MVAKKAGMANEGVLELAQSRFEEDDDELDETLTERLWGLLEMFPQPMQNALEAAFCRSFTALKVGYSMSRSIMWIAATSASILVLPVAFESERSLQQQQELHHQRQILLGPNVATSGSAGHGLLPGMGAVPPGMTPAH